MTLNSWIMKQTCSDNMLWLAYRIAFIVKITLYGLHLWLHKAEVEGPIAGSVILAAMTLKIGRYGIIQISTIQDTVRKYIAYAFIILSLWGIIITTYT